MFLLQLHVSLFGKCPFLANVILILIILLVRVVFNRSLEVLINLSIFKLLYIEFYFSPTSGRVHDFYLRFVFYLKHKAV